MARIYIAASYLRLAEARLLAELLRQHGHRVVSRWQDVPAEADYVLAESLMEGFAVEDMHQVQSAEAVVCLTGDPPDRRSRGAKHVEVGGALFTGKRVILLGPREHVFHYHPAVRVCRRAEELLEVLT